MNKLILILVFAAGIGSAYTAAKVIAYVHDQVTTINQNTSSKFDCIKKIEEAAVCRIKHHKSR